ncbi:MAG: S24 family peptidase [Dysgonomonas sp.]
MEKIITQKDRILEFLISKKISKNKFYLDTGIANGTLDKKSGITGDTIIKICTAYPEINLEWLIMGEGDMFKSSIIILNNDLKSIRDTYATMGYLDSGSISEEEFAIESPLEFIPIFSYNKNHPFQGYLSIPKLNSCDGAVYVKTDSMYPLIKPGDIVCFKLADTTNQIHWGDMYIIHTIIDGDEYLTIKNIEKSQLGEEYVCLTSYNQKYAQRDILLKDISWKAIIKAHVIYNSII